jgi:hypothetical protein
MHVRRDRTLETRSGTPVAVPVPKNGRIIWLLGLDTPFYKELVNTQAVPAGQRVLYMDIVNDTPAFRVLDFEFVPTDSISTVAGNRGIQ